MGLRLVHSSNKNGQPLALLDLGSSKVCCLIVGAPVSDAPEPRIGATLPVRKLGFGLTRSRGIRAGAVVDLAEAEEALTAAVGEAETQAGFRIEEAIVAVTSGRIQSLNFATSTKPAGNSISSADIDKMLAAGRAFAERDGRKVLHLQRLGFRLDGQFGIRNPRGMTGERLSLDLNAVTADETALRNLGNLLARSYLAVTANVAAPFASALATLGEEELQTGAAVIDMGAGTTSFAVFRDGLFLSAGSIAQGGHQLTQDIARAFSVPVMQAERIKALYGNLVGAMSDEHEYVPLTHGGNSTATGSIPTRAQLRRIIQPRIDEQLQLVREQIARCKVNGQGPERLVLTGGASQLAGLCEVAARQFGCPVRVGRPRALAGMEPAAETPDLSALVGLAYAALLPGAIGRTTDAAPANPADYVGRMKRWFKDSFWDDEQPAEPHSA